MPLCCEDPPVRMDEDDEAQEDEDEVVLSGCAASLKYKSTVLPIEFRAVQMGGGAYLAATEISGFDGKKQPLAAATIGVVAELTRKGELVGRPYFRLGCLPSPKPLANLTVMGSVTPSGIVPCRESMASSASCRVS